MKRMVLGSFAAAFLVSGHVDAQVVRRDLGSVPAECMPCEWDYFVYKHERDFWVLGGCEIGMRAVRADSSVIRLDMSFLHERYSGLPYVVFDVTPSSSCAQVTLPAIGWLWDVYLGRCMRGLPPHCADHFRMLP
jgi:hypothetical protein